MKRFRQFADGHTEDRKAANRRYYLANKERVLAKQREWREANPERWRRLNAAANRSYYARTKG